METELGSSGRIGTNVQWSIDGHRGGAVYRDYEAASTWSADELLVELAEGTSEPGRPKISVAVVNAETRERRIVVNGVVAERSPWGFIGPDTITNHGMESAYQLGGTPPRPCGECRVVDIRGGGQLTGTAERAALDRYFRPPVTAPFEVRSGFWWGCRGLVTFLGVAPSPYCLGDAFAASWSPDHQFLAVVRRDNPAQLLLLHSDLSTARYLADFPTFCMDVAVMWSPDSKQLEVVPGWCG